MTALPWLLGKARDMKRSPPGSWAAVLGTMPVEVMKFATSVEPMGAPEDPMVAAERPPKLVALAKRRDPPAAAPATVAERRNVRRENVMIVHASAQTGVMVY